MTLTDQLHIVEALASDYLNVYLVYPSSRMISIVRLDGYVTRGLESERQQLYPFESAVNSYINDRVLPDDVEMMRSVLNLEHLVSVMRNRATYDLTYRVLEDGEVEYYQMRAKRAPGSDTLILAFRSIDEEVRREQLLQKTLQEAQTNSILQQIYKKLFSFTLTVDLDSGLHTVTVGAGMTDSVSKMTASNNYAEAFFANAHYVHPEYIQSFLALTALDNLRKHTEPGFVGSLTYPLLFPGTERYVWHELNVFTEKDDRGKMRAIILGRDVTEAREQHERYDREIRAIAQRNKMLSDLTCQIYGFNLTLDLETARYTIIVGTGMKALTDALQQTDDIYRVIELGQHRVAPESLDEWNALMDIEHLRSLSDTPGLVGSLTYRFLATSGNQWHQTYVFVGTDGQGRPIANILSRDVTAEQDKIDARQQLAIANAANEAKTSFLFNMSHDIRTPMNAIMGFTELLDRHQDEPDRRKEYLTKIRESSSVLLSIINNVLEMARIERGTLTLDEVPWDAMAFNDSLFTVFEDLMEQKHIAFSRMVNIQHKRIYCDPIKLHEVFINILSNAYKYTNAGGSVTMSLQELPCERAGYVLFETTITDTGIGMSEDFLPHIFDEFSREHTTTEVKVEGTGLGMRIVKKLLDLMGATISVQSEVGVGTTFVVGIPHKIAAENEAETQHQPQATTRQVTGARLLLAEDNDLNAEIAVEILTEAGFVVERAENGLRCVEMIETAPESYYDAVLMDVQMPVMNGYEATRKIRKMVNPVKSCIPIIAMTANAFNEDRVAAIQMGMNDHLPKPVEVKRLMDTLSRYVRG